MSELLVNYPDRAPERLPLGRLRITIGRSARNDVCVPDPFASRVHAEVRREGDGYVLQDLGSANGTYYNGSRLDQPVALTHGSRIQIGETEIVFKDQSTTPHLPATTIEEDAPLPEATIAFDSAQHTTNGLLESIEAARTQSSGRFDVATIMPQRSGATAQRPAVAADHGDLLALISKVGVTLLASATLDETLRQVALLVFDAVPAERCLIMLREPTEGGELKIRAAEMRDRRPEVGEVRVSRTIVEEVVNQGRSVLTSDAQHDPRFKSSTVTFQGIRSVLAVPLGVGDRIFGMIYADSPLATSRFSEDHLKVLTTLGSVAAIRVENTRLLEEHLEQERFERELQLAREIQQRFQPTAPPVVPGYELQGISFPSYQIGGDYYDFILCSDRLVVALGDVSGKGTSAALLMSSLHAAVHAQVASCRPITETVGAVNRYLADNTPAIRFVTLFYAELDPLTGALSFINAGHNPPIIAHEGGTLEQLGAGGLPLGIVPDFDYREGRTLLRPGDVLVAYSDGVTESQNPSGEEFGTVRLQEVVARNLSRSAAGIRDKIEAALSSFAQGTPAGDDVTLVIVKREREVRQ
jgi:serine phosphatase RsbU (regulator of sigma subunit)/pSer/pThr/pTyr-binding forkhead associated (FHA) protein